MKKYLIITIPVIILILVMAGVVKFKEYQDNKNYIEQICEPICWYQPETKSWSIFTDAATYRYFPTQNECIDYCLMNK